MTTLAVLVTIRDGALTADELLEVLPYGLTVMASAIGRGITAGGTNLERPPSLTPYLSWMLAYVADDMRVEMRAMGQGDQAEQQQQDEPPQPTVSGA